jgi:hypothetical protein
LQLCIASEAIGKAIHQGKVWHKFKVMLWRFMRAV